MVTTKKSPESMLRVGELTMKEDYGSGIARLDMEKAKHLGIVEGDVLEIRGKKITGVIALSAYSSDAGSDIIRIDGITRRNCEASIGDSISIKKIKVKDAQKVSLSLSRKGINIHLTGEELNRNLLLRAVKSGDVILPNPISKKDTNKSFQELFGSESAMSLFSNSLEEKFAVVSTQPEGIVRVVDSTVVEIMPENYVAITELDEKYQAKVINVKRCPELKNLIELKGLDDIKKLITAGNIVSRYEDDNSIIYFVSYYFFRINKTVV